jgi:hypothetical protein
MYGLKTVHFKNQIFPQVVRPCRRWFPATGGALPILTAKCIRVNRESEGKSSGIPHLKSKMWGTRPSRGNQSHQRNVPRIPVGGALALANFMRLSLLKAAHTAEEGPGRSTEVNAIAVGCSYLVAEQALRPERFAARRLHFPTLPGLRGDSVLSPRPSHCPQPGCSCHNRSK